jgi:hypothetical protein
MYREAAEQDDRNISGEGITRGVNGFRVIHELERYQAHHTRDATISDGIAIFHNWSDNRVVDGSDTDEGSGDGFGIGEVNDNFHGCESILTCRGVSRFDGLIRQVDGHVPSGQRIDDFYSNPLRSTSNDGCTRDDPG